MNYSEVLSKSWKIIWKYKILWVFGILAGCAESSGGGSGGGGSSSGYTSGGYNNGNFNGNEFLSTLESYVYKVTDFIQNIPWWVWVLAAILLMALIVVSIFLGIVGRSGLIRGAAQGDTDPVKLSFGELWRESKPFFWRIFLLDLLYFGVSLAVTLILALPLILLTVLSLGLIWLCLIPLICLLVPVMWALDIFIKQSYIALINDNLGVIDAIKRAWQVFKPNLGHMIVMGLILFFVSLVIGLIISLPILIAVLPVVFGFINNTAESMRSGVIAALVIFALYMPVGILLSGVLRSYIYTAWTLTYRRLSAAPAEAQVYGIEPLPIVVPPAVEPPLS